MARHASQLLLALLLVACCQGARAQSQYSAARDAMAPTVSTGAVVGNRLAPPDVGRVPNAVSPKARVEALPVPPLDVPPAPEAIATPATPAAEPPAGSEPLTAPPAASNGTALGKPAGEALPLENPDQVRLTGDALRSTDTGTQVEGNVEIRYQDLTLRGSQAQLDRDRVWATFRGPVSLEAKLYKALGENLRINLDTEIWSIERAATEIKPEFFGQYVTASLYVRALRVNGQPSGVVGEQGLGTSCDRWPDPHWMLRADRLTYRPGEKVTFAKPTLYLFGHRILRYPWDLTLSLKSRDNRFLPEVGQNQVEGFYAKFSYGYFLNDENSGFLKLNLTQKRGVGFGVDHTLETPSQQGEFSLFLEPSMGSFSGNITHRAQLSKPFGTNVALSFQQDSGYGLASNSLDGNLTLRYDSLRSQSLLGFQQSIVSSSYSTSNRFATNFTHQQRLGTDGDWSLRSTYSASSYASDQPTDERLQTELNWRQQFRAFAVNFVANKEFDLSSALAGNNTSAVYPVPDIALTTDSTHLGERRLFGSGFESTLYLGRFEQLPDNVTISRAGLDLRLPGHVREFNPRTSLQTSGRFRQMFYSDGSARWVGEIQSQLYQKLTSSWDSRLSFSYARPNGFSPLRTDYDGPQSALYWQAVRLVPDRMRLDFTFGRDFHNGYYQDAILRAEVMLTPKNRLELQTGYSPELSEFRPLNLRWIYATPRAWWSAMTFNYDLKGGQLTDASFDIDWLPLDKWRVQFLGGYSNYGGLDQADFSITRDLHCMLASLTYITQTQEIRVGFGIKAFPSDTRTFGVGGSGQYFESNFGDQY